MKVKELRKFDENEIYVAGTCRIVADVLEAIIRELERSK